MLTNVNSESAPDDVVRERLDRLLSTTPPSTVSAEEFWATQFDAGLAFVHFPIGQGGLGLDRSLQSAINERVSAAGGSLQNWERNVVGLGMGAPTLQQHASAELRDRLLRPLFSCEEIWCQLFSEPGAGSDIAGLATTAVKAGDNWIVNGQKVWTTLAHKARWGLLLARTDSDVPKHRGLTYFVLDMAAPGIDVRPLFEMTGEAEFNEVFLTDVCIPDGHRLSEVGHGWGVAMTTLMNERVSVGNDTARSDGGLVGPALRMWREFEHDHPTRRNELMKLWSRSEVLRLTTTRAAAAATRGTPGPEGSIAKLMWAMINQASTTYAVELMGAQGMLYPDGYHFDRPEFSSVNVTSARKAFLRARANSIEGGTSEIMRNILAERILGLPSDVRTDRDLPWRDVPRN